MMLPRFQYTLCVLSIWVQTAVSITMLSKQYLIDKNPENDIADYIFSKGYLPSDKDLPMISYKKDVDHDLTYLLSKLSDEGLINLLNSQPKKSEFNLNDLIKIATEAKSYSGNNKLENGNLFQNQRETMGNFAIDKNNQRDIGKGQHQAFFKLEHKPVNDDPSYNALMKLNNLLQSHAQTTDSGSAEDMDKKELLFDILVSQLKALCCKKSKTVKHNGKQNYKSGKLDTREYLFLIVNEEIKSNVTDDLIRVDPDSLENNSTVLLLGPITSPLTNEQLKLVMKRISNEMSKPEYLPLLQQLADGTISDKNVRLLNSVVSGPETRRYIKPHRCNYQSKLARVFGGPRWLVCTGYLNLNYPSLYD